MIQTVFQFLEQRAIARWLLLGSLAWITWIYFNAIDGEVAGFTHDDGVYLIAGRALAEGKGFILEHVVGQPAQVKYPILYPLILALGWKIYPSFPENLWFLTALTTSFTILGLYLSYRFFRSYHFSRLLSITLIWMIAGNFYFFYYGSSLMSEGPYYFLSLLTILFTDRILSKSPNNTPISKQNWLLIILFSTLTFHARIIGLALIVAISVYLVFKKSLKTGVAYFTATALLTIVPWFVWITLNQPQTINALNYPLVYAYSNYGNELWTQVQSGTYFSRVSSTFANTLWRLLENLFNVIPNFFKIISRWNKTWVNNPTITLTHSIILAISTYALLGYFLILLIRWSSDTAVKIKNSTLLTGLKNTNWSISALYTIFYCCILVLWGYPTQPGRFLLMLSPFLFLYFFKPLLTLNTSQPNRQKLLKQTLVIFFCVLSLISVPKTFYSVDYIRKKHWIESGQLPFLWKEYKALFEYIKQNTPKNAVISTDVDAVLYLYTGRKTYILMGEGLQSPYIHETTTTGNSMLSAFKHYGVRYLVMDPHIESRIVTYPHNMIATFLTDQHPERFQLRFAAPFKTVGLFEFKPE